MFRLFFFIPCCLGGLNAALNPSDYSGATPQRQVVATPNVFATPLRGQNVPGGVATPMRGSGGMNLVCCYLILLSSFLVLGVGATPRRDGLGLNEDDGFSTERIPT